MKIVFTKNSSVVSKMIRWIFDEPVSHVAFVFDDKWLVQSNLLGIGIEWLHRFVKKSTIVEAIDYPMELVEEEEVFQSLIAEEPEKDGWDFPAGIYFAWRGLLFKYFKLAIPKTNPWNKKHLRLCTEMAAKLPVRLTKLPEGIDLGIVTPYQLMGILKGARQ